MKTPQQIENIHEALRMWATVPPENVAGSLGAWSNSGGRPHCDTHACFGGWCAWWPAFRAIGVRADPVGRPQTRNSWGHEVASELFGDDCAFDARGMHPADRWFTGTDHALVVHRLNWMLNHD